MKTSSIFDKLQNWMQRKKNVARIVTSLYRRLDQDVKAQDKKWLNLGYWEHATNVQDACRDLVDLVIEHAELQPGDVILDAGFGYGDQDIQILDKFDDLTIHGVNITDFQVEYARELGIRNGYEKRYFPVVADASRLPYQTGFFDKVISVEAAFHFNTREAFLKESYRTLKDNGSICMIDCLPDKNGSGLDPDKFAYMGVPGENLYSVQKYVSLMESIGFTEIEVFDLSELVLPFFVASRKSGGWRTDREIILGAEERKQGLEEWRNSVYYETSIYSYIMIKAARKNH